MYTLPKTYRNVTKALAILPRFFTILHTMPSYDPPANLGAVVPRAKIAGSDEDLLSVIEDLWMRKKSRGVLLPLRVGVDRKIWNNVSIIFENLKQKIICHVIGKIWKSYVSAQEG